MAARRRARRKARREGDMGGALSNKQMRKAMNQMNVEDLSDVDEVIIRRRDEEIVLRGADVQAMTVQGQKIYTITGGRSERRPRGSPETSEKPAKPVEVREEDVHLIMEQAKCDYDTAKKHLVDAGGDLAAAIVRAMS